MTLANDLKALIEPIRAIPGQLGLRPYTVTVTVTSRTGSHGLVGTATDTTTTIANSGQPPKVRFLNDEQRALGGLPAGSVEVGPITPDYVGGGLSFSTITGGSSVEKDQVKFTLTGPEFPSGAEYRLDGSKSDKALHYMLTLTPIASV